MYVETLMVVLICKFIYRACFVYIPNHLLYRWPYTSGCLKLPLQHLLVRQCFDLTDSECDRCELKGYNVRGGGRNSGAAEMVDMES